MFVQMKKSELLAMVGQTSGHDNDVLIIGLNAKNVDENKFILFSILNHETGLTQCAVSQDFKDQYNAMSAALAVRTGAVDARSVGVDQFKEAVQQQKEAERG